MFLGPTSRASDWWELMHKYPSSLTPWVGWSWSSTYAPRVPSGIKAVTYPLLDVFPVFLPFPTSLPLSPKIIFQIHYLHLSYCPRSASGIIQTKTSYEMRITVPAFKARELRLKVTWVPSQCPPSWILVFTPGYVATCTSGKTVRGLSWDSPPS